MNDEEDMDDYGEYEDGEEGMPVGFDEEEYNELFLRLKKSGQGNREFIKVLDILDRD